MLPYFLNSSLPEAEFNRIIKELHRDSLGQPDLRRSRVGKDVTKYPIPECMCNDTKTHPYMWVNSEDFQHDGPTSSKNWNISVNPLNLSPLKVVCPPGQWWSFGSLGILRETAASHSICEFAFIFSSPPLPLCTNSSQARQMSSYKTR